MALECQSRYRGGRPAHSRDRVGRMGPVAQPGEWSRRHLDGGGTAARGTEGVRRTLQGQRRRRARHRFAGRFCGRFRSRPDRTASSSRPTARKVFVSSDGASTVSVIDTATDQIVDSIDVGQTPHGLAISPDGREVLVSGFGTNQAEVVDTSSNQIIGRVPVPQPHNSAISPDGRLAYVGSQQQGETALVAVDLTSMTRTGVVPLDKTPRALTFSPDGRWVYFTRRRRRCRAGARRRAQRGYRPDPRRGVAAPAGVHPGWPAGAGRRPGPRRARPARSGQQHPACRHHGRRGAALARDQLGRPDRLRDGRELQRRVRSSIWSRSRVVATVPVGNGPRKIAVQPDRQRCGLTRRGARWAWPWTACR